MTSPFPLNTLYILFLFPFFCFVHQHHLFSILGSSPFSSFLSPRLLSLPSFSSSFTTPLFPHLSSPFYPPFLLSTLTPSPRSLLSSPLSSPHSSSLLSSLLPSTPHLLCILCHPQPTRQGPATHLLCMCVCVRICVHVPKHVVCVCVCV